MTSCITKSQPLLNEISAFKCRSRRKDGLWRRREATQWHPKPIRCEGSIPLNHLRPVRRLPCGTTEKKLAERTEQRNRETHHTLLLLRVKWKHFQARNVRTLAFPKRSMRAFSLHILALLLQRYRFSAPNSKSSTTEMSTNQCIQVGVHLCISIKSSAADS